jgi:hypothetical protein
MSKAIITAVLSTLYKMDTEEIAEALKDSDAPETSNKDADIIATITKLDADRVKGFNERAKKRFDDGHKKGKSESLSDLEQELRDEYSVDDANLKGLDLVKHIATQVETKAAQSKGGKAGDLTEEAVRKSAIYLDLEKKLAKRESELLKEKEDAVNNLQKEYSQKETKQKVSEKALQILDGLNPVLPEDATKSQRMKQLFIQSEILNNGIEIAENGDILLLDADGKPREDEHGHTLKFEDFVKTAANSTFEFQVAKDRKSPGNGNDGKNNPPKTGKDGRSLPTPKTLEELTQLVQSKDYSVDERQAIMDNYEAANAPK